MSGLVVDQASRTIAGLVVPYRKAVVNGRNWCSFAPGFAVYDKVPLLRDHDHSQRVGRAIRLEDTPDGLLAVLRVNPGSLGDLLLALVADRTLGASVGITDEVLRRDPADRRVLVVTRAVLTDISLTARPAFDTR